MSPAAPPLQPGVPLSSALPFGNEGAEICVIGRVDFSTGIGTLTVGACEALSRAYPVCILPTEPHRRSDEAVYLPNGRRIPVCRNPAAMKVSLFCDVLWNGVHDYNHFLVPQDSLRIAWIAYDSDEFPPQWVQILNDRFDMLLVTSPHLIAVAEASGVEIPVGAMPIPLDLAPALAMPPPPRQSGRVRFGSVAAFHPRKGVDTLLEAFLRAFAGRDDVELLLHSNLAFGDTVDRVHALIKERGGTNVTVSHAPLSAADKDKLIRSIDVFVNCSRGEGYSVGPREALASGAALVLSGVGGHLDLAGPPGVFTVAPEITRPARYPEIDGMVFGRQSAVTVDAVGAALHTALRFAQSAEFGRTVRDRRAAAGSWGFDALSARFASVIDRFLPQFRRPLPPCPAVVLPPALLDVAERKLGRRAAKLTHPNRVVQLAHDGGFFSVFNAFVTQAVWEQRDERCHAVLPDWDISRMLDASKTGRMTSFCYGRPEDGNVWCKLFQPVFGFSEAEMNDPAELYGRSVRPLFVHNERREPQMTYIHAYKLYNSARFAAWRRQYHDVFARHVLLQPGMQAEVDAFAARHFRGGPVIGAHVRHPSHSIEQPTAAMAHEDAYLRRIHAEVARRGLVGSDWSVFLATDQERVVHRFQAEFGDRVSFQPGATRTPVAADTAFEQLSEADKRREGHQVQHLAAADPANWTADLAREVIRDAWLLARCDALLHVVSNVSTAVSFLNPRLEMVFCAA